MKINYNFEKVIGKIKPMHGVGQPPLLGINTDKFAYLNEANIPYSRLHDVGGGFGGNLFVDIPNIFRDFNADENDPASYDFVFTDILIKGLIDYKCEPVYRLGVTIENSHHIKAYRIFPPSNPAKWARICEHIIRHYNEGWADGFHFGIKYWEIWNEPDNGIDDTQNMMWHGTKEQFYELYRVTSKHLRMCFGDSIKIGGYGHSGFYVVDGIDSVESIGAGLGLTEAPTDWEIRTQYFITFFNEFLELVKKENLPFDFFSHHSYADVEHTIKRQKYAEKRLAEEGFSNVEIHLNEWNTSPYVEERGTQKACASAVAMMCAMQNMKMDMMCYYDARISQSVYGGLFNPIKYMPFCTYYGFKAFGKLFAMKNQVFCENNYKNIYTLAATDGKLKGAIIANIGEDCEIFTDFDRNSTVYLIDEEHFMEKTELNPNKLFIKTNQVIYLEA